METQEEIKRKPGRPAKEVQITHSNQSEDLFEKLIENGIPLRKCVFHKTIVSWNNEPEYAFYAPEQGLKKSRIAKMWYTPHGVAWEGEKGIRGIVPLANVSDTRIL